MLNAAALGGETRSGLGTSSAMAALRPCLGTAEQDLDGMVIMTLGAKGVVELELISSGECWVGDHAMIFTPAIRLGLVSNDSTAYRVRPTH